MNSIKKSTAIIQRHNYFCAAVWAAVQFAKKSHRQHIHVAQSPGQKRWQIVRHSFLKRNGWSSFFEVKSYRHRAAHNRVFQDARQAIDRWRRALYLEIARGNSRFIPRGPACHAREILLQFAVRENHVEVIRLLVKAGACVNYDAGRALRIAFFRRNQAAVVALIAAGASILSTQSFIHRPTGYAMRPKWIGFVAHLIAMIREANLDEKLPVFDELVDLANAPALRPAIVGLAAHYPMLSGKLL